MKVILAEKPSVARDIAKCLGVTQRKDGYIEGNGYQVTWAFGHLVELKEPDEYFPEWKRWTLETLPIIPEKGQFWELATRYRELKIKPAKRLRNTVVAPVHFPSKTTVPFSSPAPVAYRATQ